MRILIDADGCPVVDIAVKVAKEKAVKCIILCDTSHQIEKNGATTITVSKGADSVDFALVNMVESKDIVITQDYGLAAMCLARNAIAINQNGLVYHNDNIDALLYARHTAQKIRKSSKHHLKGPPKRTVDQDIAFEKRLRELIESSIEY